MSATARPWKLSSPSRCAKAANGTRLRLVHSGFELPRNESAFKTMGEGWKKVVRTLDSIAAEQDSAKKPH